MINQDWGGAFHFSLESHWVKKGWVISLKTTGPSDIPSNSFRITCSILDNFEGNDRNKVNHDLIDHQKVDDQKADDLDLRY